MCQQYHKRERHEQQATILWGKECTAYRGNVLRLPLSVLSQAHPDKRHGRDVFLRVLEEGMSHHDDDGEIAMVGQQCLILSSFGIPTPLFEQERQEGRENLYAVYRDAELPRVVEGEKLIVALVPGLTRGRPIDC